MAEPNPSNPVANTPYGSPAGTMPSQLAEFLIQINPPITHLVSTDQGFISNPSPPPPPPQNYGSIQQMNQTYISPPLVTELSFIPPNQPIPYQNQAGLNNYPNRIELSSAMLQQDHGSIISQPNSTRPTELVNSHSTIPVLGSFNLKVKPIQLLHVNSLPTSLSSNDSGSSDQQPNRTEQPPVQPTPGPADTKPTPVVGEQPKNDADPKPQQEIEQMPCSFKANGKHRQVLNHAGNLANLLPTGTVLAFQALIPSLMSTNGKCDAANKYMMAMIILACAATCLLSSFTDSFLYENKVYHGVATHKGLYVLNYDNRDEEEKKISKELEKLKITLVDFVHALGSLMVFLVFAFCGFGVVTCYFPESETEYSIVAFLPLMAGVLSSFLFSIFPSKRRGIGYTNYMARKP